MINRSASMVLLTTLIMQLSCSTSEIEEKKIYSQAIHDLIEYLRISEHNIKLIVYDQKLNREDLFLDYIEDFESKSEQFRRLIKLVEESEPDSNSSLQLKIDSISIQYENSRNNFLLQNREDFKIAFSQISSFKNKYSVMVQYMYSRNDHGLLFLEYKKLEDKYVLDNIELLYLS